MRAKVRVDHGDQLTSRQNFVAIPEDPDEWEDERNFARRLNELLDQHEEGIEDFKVIGFTDDGKDVYEPEDIKDYLN